MKKFLVSSLLVLAAAGMSEARAGISIGISVGESHRSNHRPPVVVCAPPPRPFVVARPCPPPVVVIDPCEPGHYRSRECSHPSHRGAWGRPSHGHYDRHDRRSERHDRDDREHARHR